MNDQPKVELLSVHATWLRAKNEGIGISEKAINSLIHSGMLSYVPVGNRTKMINWQTFLTVLAEGQKIDNTPRPYFGRGSRGGSRR